MYRARTLGIEVTVRPDYVEDESRPEEGRWFWAYTVIISNFSESTVQLESRYWSITNALGNVEEVSGLGVIGEQPILHSGDSFQYTSGCPLNTPSGTMEGHYVMLRDDGGRFNADIPGFSLDLPGTRRTLN